MASPRTVAKFAVAMVWRAAATGRVPTGRALPFLFSAALLIALSCGNAYTPGAGLDGTPHDWSKGSGTSVLLWIDRNGSATTYNTGTPWIDPATSRQGVATVANGKCGTCHLSSAVDDASLQWNYTLPVTAYRWSDPRTTAGTAYPAFAADKYQGPTVRCLSCHDGVLANGCAVSQGTDLSHNHPVAMPYPLNGMPSSYNAVQSGAYIARGEWVPDPMASNGVRLFKADAAGNVVAGVAAGRTGIECSSCHDVHNGTRVKDQFLLTGRLGGIDRGEAGYLCTKCHAK